MAAYSRFRTYVKFLYLGIVPSMVLFALGRMDKVVNTRSYPRVKKIWNYYRCYRYILSLLFIAVAVISFL